mmetsp:Transcript_36570/g.116371  ORF Transcript_36570/g.116371 Transcript_36570/m.116371 type:complete len:416 (-) Transcript_36570:807-2054(-)
MLASGDPAHRAVAQRPALHPHLRRKALLLWPLQGLHGLASGKHPHGLGAQAWEPLLKRHLLQHCVVLRARVRVDGARITLGRDPADLVVLQGPAAHAGDACVLVVDGPLQSDEHLTLVQLPHDITVLDVLLIGHGDRRGAGVVFAVRLCEGRARLVSDSEPARGAVAAGLATHPERGGEGLLPRAFDEFEHLVRLEGADKLLVLTLEALLQRHFLGHGVVWLHDLLQEGRALVALEADPALHGVAQGPGADTRQAQLLVNARPLEHLDDLVDIGRPEDLGLADLEVVGDGDGLGHHKVLLEEGAELALAHAAGLDVPAEQQRLLRVQGEVLQGMQELAQCLLRSTLLAGLQQLGKELLGAHAPLPCLRAQRCRGLAGPGVDEGPAGAPHGLQAALAALRRRPRSHLQALQLAPHV